VSKLENEVYLLKSKVGKLEEELRYREEELGRARVEIGTAKAIQVVNKYSDEEYELLQTHFFQLQKSSTEMRSQLSNSEFEMNQLTSKM
jgi:hypothetical protein